MKCSCVSTTVDHVTALPSPEWQADSCEGQEWRVAAVWARESPTPAFELHINIYKTLPLSLSLSIVNSFTRTFLSYVRLIAQHDIYPLLTTLYTSLLLPTCPLLSPPPPEVITGRGHSGRRESPALH